MFSVTVLLDLSNNATGLDVGKDCFGLKCSTAAAAHTAGRSKCKVQCYEEMVPKFV